jgi:hypothetical protein
MQAAHCMTSIFQQSVAFFVRRGPWSWMIAVNAAVMAALVLYKYYDYPIIQYSFLLANYHFGFMKRALLGSVLALFENQTGLREVFWIHLGAWLTTMTLFFMLFKRTFGFAGDRLQLFVFTFGSPFFFKNFFHTIGFFDIYGCLFAIVTLLIPVSRLFPLIVGAGCTALVLIHHIHFLLYLPLIGVIAIIRYFCLHPFSRADIAYALVAALPPCAAFLASVLIAAPVPPDQLLAYMRTRAADPLPVVNITIWYTTAAEELTKTAHEFARNAPRLPVFAALILLHWPVIRFTRSMHASIRDALHRNLLAFAFAGITLGYVVVFVFVFDYARWFSNWAVCMILLMHTAALLPRRNDAPAPSFATTGREKLDTTLGWILTAIPRVGLQIPF